MAVVLPTVAVVQVIAVQYIGAQVVMAIRLPRREVVSVASEVAVLAAVAQAEVGKKMCYKNNIFNKKVPVSKKNVSLQNLRRW